MKYTVGIDLVSISRIATLLEKYPNKFRDYIFSEREQTYCESQYYPPEHYAGRWAVKEAYIKALNTEHFQPNLTTIEIMHNPTPELTITGEGLDVLSIAAESRDSNPENIDIDISLSYERKVDMAIGIVFIIFN